MTTTTATTNTATQSAALSSSFSNQKKPPQTNPQKTVQTDFSIRNPHWSYIHLEHMHSTSTSSSISNINQKEGKEELDPVTAQLHLSAALSTLHGLHGLAIPIDLLHITGQQVWLRTPADDRSAVLAAVGGWMSNSGDRWRIKGWSHWSASALGRDAGQDLFDAA